MHKKQIKEKPPECMGNAQIKKNRDTVTNRR